MFKFLICFVLLGLLFFSVWSCRDDSKLPIDMDEIPYGIFIAGEMVTPILDVTNLDNSQIEYEIEAPSNNVSKYDVYVCRQSGVDFSDTVFVKSYSTFPILVELSAAEIATGLGITNADYVPGDILNFIGIATGSNGETASFDDLDQDVGTNPGERQGFNFTGYVSCPFDAQEAAGTYEWVVDPWETFYDDGIFEVVAGPGENQITCLDVFDHPTPTGGTYDMIIDVDPTTGIAIVERQDTWWPGNWGLPANWGIGWHEGEGFVFSCSGLITLQMTVGMALGNWGVQAYGANKVVPK